MTDLSKTIFIQRQSVIANISNYGRSLSLVEEKEDDYWEIISEQEDNQFTSTKVYLPGSPSTSKDGEPRHKTDDFIFKYVHNKCRTPMDHSVKESFPKKRESVICHAAITNKPMII